MRQNISLERGHYRLAEPAIELQAVAGAASDLRTAEEMLLNCIETDTELHTICDELEQACWTTAVIRYERAFSGRSWPFNSVVLDQLTSAQHETHHFIRFLRDKLFAHAIGGLGEDFEVTAYVCPVYGGGFELAGVGPRPRYITSPGTDLAGEFLDLLRAVRPLVDAHEWVVQEATRLKLRAIPLEHAIKGRPIEQRPLTLNKTAAEFRRYLRKAYIPPGRRNSYGTDNS